MSAISDLIIADKDVSKSCVFGFPDRPPDTLPPHYPPPSPPPCYPYCRFDDWPIPIDPIIFPPPPPAYNHGPVTALECSSQCTTGDNQGLSEIPSTILSISGLGSIQIIDNNFTDIIRYLGGERTAENNIGILSRHLTNNVNLSIDGGVNVPKLLITYFSVNVFLITITMQAFSDLLTVGQVGHMSSFMDVTGVGISRISYTYAYIVGSPLPVNGIFQWYIHRSLGIYSYALVNGVQLVPTITP